jgi:hypothetical protein
VNEPPQLATLGTPDGSWQVTTAELMDRGATFLGKPVTSIEMHLEDGSVVTLDLAARRGSIRIAEEAADGEPPLYGQLRELVRSRDPKANDIRIEFRCSPTPQE